MFSFTSFSPGFRMTRPHWGYRQVRTLRGVHAGQIYWKITSIPQYNQKIIVLCEPFQDSRGNWKYKYANWPFDKKGRNFSSEGFCSDAGVVAYNDGLWNRINHLRRTWHRCKSNAELTLIKSGLTKGL